MVLRAKLGLDSSSSPRWSFFSLYVRLHLRASILLFRTSVFVLRCGHGPITTVAVGYCCLFAGYHHHCRSPPVRRCRPSPATACWPPLILGCAALRWSSLVFACLLVRVSLLFWSDSFWPIRSEWKKKLKIYFGSCFIAKVSVWTIICPIILFWTR